MYTGGSFCFGQKVLCKKSDKLLLSYVPSRDSGSLVQSFSSDSS